MIYHSMPWPSAKQSKDEMKHYIRMAEKELVRLKVPLIYISPFDSVREQAAKLGPGAKPWLQALLAELS
jgi:hypothetical protein